MRSLGTMIAVFIALVGAPAASAAVPSATATVEPPRPSFGDTFSYVVDVVVDPSRADDVTVRAETGPFVSVSQPHVSRTVEDGRAHVTVTQRLACLGAACLPRGGDRRVTLPPVVVDGARVGGLAPVVVAVRPRVEPAAVAADAPTFRRATTLPEPTTRISSSVLVGVLVAVGVLLLLAASTALVLPRLRGDYRLLRGAEDPVERASRLLRESAARPPADRRRAASLASRVVPRRPVAEEAARLAWSRPAPEGPAAVALANRVDESEARPT